ncbi:tryptophan 2,3-dioxygenase family protein [Amorphus orientalis]|uniref:Tryptophan 2,3-dioxygenase n=1 Tax=Amorphus orientalis TaxID=649198 RepID=A0AAE3VS62_9HYPH|nr:tryptophan 2,3-dioxygenase family protein [Amorphus orientalis]MDQ0316968.1 tryptophan 2,3-dioxygenase [Amorphus orientalis]
MATSSGPEIGYADYLRLDKILDAQDLQSTKFGREAHDEMLFIVIHQAYELWFKQILHELDRVQANFANTPLDDSRLGQILHSLLRVHEILKLLVHQIDILETMTPQDFLEFRDLLTSGSGFQSLQFRLVETRLGLSPEHRLLYDGTGVHSRLKSDERDALVAAEQTQSLVEQLDAWLSRTPFVKAGSFAFSEAYRTAVLDFLTKDIKTLSAHEGLDAEQREAETRALEKAKESFKALFEPEAYEGAWRMSPEAVQAALFITVYRDRPVLHMPSRLLATLMDIDEAMTLWRYRHALMVERMIGVKIGTGGSSGHEYLRKTAEKHRIFTDLFHLSTYLIPRSALPELPAHVERMMKFVYAEEPAE